MKPPERLDGVVESGRAAALLLQPAHDVEVQLGGERALGLHKGHQNNMAEPGFMGKAQT